jgi:YVTN family beta-propeller protein
VLDLESRKLGARPMSLALSPDDKLLFVSTGRGDTIAVIDVAKHAVTRLIDVGARPWSIAASADGKRVFSADGTSNDLSIVDVVSGQVERRSPSPDCRGRQSLAGSVTKPPASFEPTCDLPLQVHLSSKGKQSDRNRQSPTCLCRTSTDSVSGDFANRCARSPLIGVVATLPIKRLHVPPHLSC